MVTELNELSLECKRQTRLFEQLVFFFFPHSAVVSSSEFVFHERLSYELDICLMM